MPYFQFLFCCIKQKNHAFSVELTRKRFTCRSFRLHRCRRSCHRYRANQASAACRFFSSKYHLPIFFSVTSIARLRKNTSEHFVNSCASRPGTTFISIHAAARENTRTRGGSEKKRALSSKKRRACIVIKTPPCRCRQISNLHEEQVGSLSVRAALPTSAEAGGLRLRIERCFGIPDTKCGLKKGDCRTGQGDMPDRI